MRPELKLRPVVAKSVRARPEGERKGVILP